MRPQPLAGRSQPRELLVGRARQQPVKQCSRLAVREGTNGTVKRRLRLLRRGGPLHHLNALAGLGVTHQRDDGNGHADRAEGHRDDERDHQMLDVARLGETIDRAHVSPP